MTGETIRIEIQGLATEVEDAQRDLRATLGTLEDRLLPRRAVRRLAREHEPVEMLATMTAAGFALGLLGEKSAGMRLVGLLATGIAGALVYRLGRLPRNEHR